MEDKKPKCYDHIEYIVYPPPLKLKKAMACRHAKDLCDDGKLRMTCALWYRKSNPHNPMQNDPYENEWMGIINDEPCYTDSSNPPFIFCASTLDADSDKLLTVDSTYDTIVTIHDTLTFFRQIVNKVRQLICCSFGASHINYDRGEPSTSYWWWGNTFQKCMKYSYQKEYRLAFQEQLRQSSHPYEAITPLYRKCDLACNDDKCNPYAYLTIGSCAKILTLEVRKR